MGINRALLMGVLALLLAALMVACGGDDEEASAPAAAPAQERRRRDLVLDVRVLPRGARRARRGPQIVYSVKI